MIFIDTKRFSPVVQGKDLPRENDLFYKDYQEVMSLNQKQLIQYYIDKNIVIDEQWWKKQIYRCLNGYMVENAIAKGGDFLIDGIDALWTEDDCFLPEYNLWIKNKTVHISGFYYFYLNFWKMRGAKEDEERKTLINPNFLAHQFLFSRRLEMMIEQEKDCQETKSRQLGYSEEIACKLGYNYLFLPMSQNIIVAGEQTDADNTFFNFTRGLDVLSNTQFTLRKARGFDNKQHVKSLNGSEVFTENANDDPEALSRYSPYFVVFEEVGKGKKGWSLKVAGHVKPSIKVGTKKTGYLLYIGTGGSMDKGVTDLQERAYHPEQHDCLSFTNKWKKEGDTGNVKVAHFCPAYTYKILDKDGNPKVKEGIEYILKERVLLSAKEKYTHISTQAIYLDDVFQTNSGGYLGPERVRLLMQRYNYIISHKETQITRKGHLEWNNTKDMNAGVRFVDATEEDLIKEQWYCEIVEEPDTTPNGDVYANLYVGGTDTYNQDEAETSDSLGSFTVYKKWRNESDSPFSNTWVMLILERPGIDTGGQERFYEHVLMGCIYYNVLNNIEYVNPHIFDYFDKKNAYKYLMEKPSLAFAGQIKEQRSSNRYGTDKSLKPHVLSNFRDKIDEEQINRLWIPRQILAFAKFRYVPGDKYNCDITMASAESLIAYKETENLSIVDVKSRTIEKASIWREVGGILQRVAI